MSQLFASGSQSIGVSASISILLMNIQGWFPLRLTGLISLLSNGLSRVLSSTTVQKHQFFSTQPSLWSISHIHIWLLEKPQLWLLEPLLVKWCFSFFNMLSRYVTAFLVRSKHLYFMGTVTTSVILEPKKRKSVTVFFLHLFAMKWWDWISWS